MPTNNKNLFSIKTWTPKIQMQAKQTLTLKSSVNNLKATMDTVQLISDELKYCSWPLCYLQPYLPMFKYCLSSLFLLTFDSWISNSIVSVAVFQIREGGVASGWFTKKNNQGAVPQTFLLWTYILLISYSFCTESTVTSP